MQTTSDSQLGRIELADNVSFCEVRLRRNIRKEIEDDAEVWRADEVIGKLPLGTTTAYVDANFDELWMRFEDEGKPESEVIVGMKETLSTHEDAIVELDMLVNASPTTMEDLVEAVMELAELIGGE